MYDLVTNSRSIADKLENELGKPSVVDKTDERRRNYFQFWNLTDSDMRKIKLCLYEHQGNFGVLNSESGEEIWPAANCVIIAEALDII